MTPPSIPDLARRLSYHARQSAMVRELRSALPALPGEGLPAPGLYLDVGDRPGLVVNGELRVSVARVYSVTEEGKELLGQVQATRVLDHPLARWDLRLYLHVPRFFSTVRSEDESSWWLGILEQHYQGSAAEVAFQPAVPA